MGKADFNDLNHPACGGVEGPEPVVLIAFLLMAWRKAHGGKSVCFIVP